MAKATLNSIQASMNAMQSSLNAVARTVGAVENRLGSVENRLGLVEVEVRAANTRIGRLESKVDTHFKTARIELRKIGGDIESVRGQTARNTEQILGIEKRLGATQ